MGTLSKLLRIFYNPKSKLIDKDDNEDIKVTKDKRIIKDFRDDVVFQIFKFNIKSYDILMPTYKDLTNVHLITYFLPYNNIAPPNLNNGILKFTLTSNFIDIKDGYETDIESLIVVQKKIIDILSSVDISNLKEYILHNTPRGDRLDVIKNNITPSIVSDRYMIYNLDILVESTIHAMILLHNTTIDKIKDNIKDKYDSDGIDNILKYYNNLDTRALGRTLLLNIEKIVEPELYSQLVKTTINQIHYIAGFTMTKK